MPRRCFSYLIILAALLLFCSCSGANGPALPAQAGLSEEPSASPLHTSADYDNRFAGGSFCSFTETDKAFLWHSIESGFPFLMYFDKEACENGEAEYSGILCARPECMHSGRDCGGFISEDIPSLTNMDGMLYWVGWENDGRDCMVYRSKLDYTEKEKLCKLDFVGKYEPVRFFFTEKRLTFTRSI